MCVPGSNKASQLHWDSKTLTSLFASLSIETLSAIKRHDVSAGGSMLNKLCAMASVL